MAVLTHRVGNARYQSHNNHGTSDRANHHDEGAPVIPLTIGKRKIPSRSGWKAPQRKCYHTSCLCTELRLGRIWPSVFCLAS